MRTFTVGEQDFLLDGQPFRILSGAIHYFRVHPGQWADRIAKARMLGLNTIETYVAWNAHEPVRGEWSWTGGLDLGRFLDEIGDRGMHAIVRPGPYICAEWDGGGLPAWLFTDPEVGVRRHEARYLAEVTRYLETVYEVVAPRQVDRGGPVVLVQIENEYGAYGNDADYLRHLVDVTRAAGIVVPLVTVDQPQDDMLANGSLPDLHRTASFGSRAVERLSTLRRHQPIGPLMAMEYWDGWFDHWGEEHHTTDAQAAAADLDDLLSTGASVNLYMFHGGTNFGLTNGANADDHYAPIVTSYDYDAPLDEAGNPTAKYWAFRDVIARHAPVPVETPDVHPVPTWRVTLTRRQDFLEAVRRSGTWTRHSGLPTMDAVGQYRGLMLYRASVPPSAAPRLLEVGEVRDRASVFADGVQIGWLARDRDRSIPVPAWTSTLELLVEDQGRVNYGPRIGEAKGLIGPATLGGVAVDEWLVLPIDLPAVMSKIEFGGVPVAPVPGAPVVLDGAFDLAEPSDLFLDMTGLGRGLAWIDDFCLGRFWNIGPQRSLFVPREETVAGANRVLVLDLEPSADDGRSVPR